MGVIFLGLLYCLLLVYAFRPAKLKPSQTPKTLPEAIRESLVQFTQGFTYSEMEGKNPIFEIKAARVLGFKGQTYQLEEVAVVFYSKKGLVQLHSPSITFDLQRKNFFIKGFVSLALKDPEVTLQTQNLYYNHKTRILRSSQPIWFTFQDRLWGKLSNLTFSLQNHTLAFRRSVRIFGSMGEVFLAKVALFHLASQHIQFPRGVWMASPDMTAFFDRLTLKAHQQTWKGEGSCGEVETQEGTLVSPTLFFEFSPQGGSIRCPEGVRLISRKGNLIAHQGSFQVDDQTIRSFVLEEGFSMDQKDRHMQGWELRGHTNDEGEQQINGFGNLLVCLGNQMIQADKMQALLGASPSYKFWDAVSLRDGPLWAQAEEVIYLPENRYATLRGNVFVHYLKEGLHMQGEKGMVWIEPFHYKLSGKSKIWSNQLQLGCEEVEGHQDGFLARGDVQATFFSQDPPISMAATELSYFPKKNNFSAVGPLKVQKYPYTIEAGHLQGVLHEGKIQEAYFIGDIQLTDGSRQYHGKGEILTLLGEDQGVFFLEGCPAKLEEPVQGNLTSPTIVGDSATGQLYLLDPTGKTRLEINHGTTQSL